MEQPKLISERKFTTAQEMLDSLYGIIEDATISGCKSGYDINIRLYDSTEEDVTPRQQGILRLWEETLTDASKVYNLHIL